MKQGMILVPALLLTLLGGCESMPMHMNEDELLELAENYGTETAAVSTMTTPAPALHPPTYTTVIIPPTETTVTTEATTTTLPPEPTVPTAEPIDGDVVIQNGVMVVNSGTDHARALETYSNSPANCERYADILNSFQTLLPSSVNVYSMPCPTSAAYYIPEDKAASYGDQGEEIELIASHLNGVTPVSVYDALLYHRDEAIYSRTDYHWFPLGAYYAAEEFAEAADVPFAPIGEYDSVEREGFVGAFAAVNDISELYNAPECFTYYKPSNLAATSCYYYDNDFTNGRSGAMFHEDNVVSASYTVFIGTDDCIFQADTDVDNGRVLVIFKDSFGNALVPFLTNSFSTIYLCDFRYFNTNAAAFVENVGATDVVFAIGATACMSSVKLDTLAETLGV